MATLTGMLTGYGSGSVSVPATRRRRTPAVVEVGRDIGLPIDLPGNLTAAQHHRRLINAYGKVPQYKGATRPKLTAAERGVIEEVYSRFSDPLAAWARRQYRQHALHIPNIASATPAQVSRARAHHALGVSPIQPGPPPRTQTVSGVGAGQGTGSASLSAAMSGSPTGGKPVLPEGVSAAELSALSKALTSAQRRAVGLL